MALGRETLIIARANTHPWADFRHFIFCQLLMPEGYDHRTVLPGGHLGQNQSLAVDAPAPEPMMPATILVVEDNDLNMKLFDDLLSAQGYQVLKARDGLEGLYLARKHLPDLILMDVQLPGSLSGLDVTRALKKEAEFEAVPIVAVTAFAMKGDEEQILAAGCDAYISKPISSADFIKAIRHYLSRDPG
jgi:two-component system cell cycle response regulator DivK